MENRKILEETVKKLNDYYKVYLDSGEAVKDFQRVRKKQPHTAIEFAERRTYGPVAQKVEHSGTITLAALLVERAEPKEIAVDCTDLTDRQD
jgi:hypothetical protein